MKYHEVSFLYFSYSMFISLSLCLYHNDGECVAKNLKILTLIYQSNINTYLKTLFTLLLYYCDCKLI